MDGKQMTDAELESLLADLQSDRSERTQSAFDGAKIREAICAFANDLPNHNAPGVVFVGARDDGSCAGLTITEELLLTLADMRSDGNIVPFPTMSVQNRYLNGCGMAVVVVQPSYAPPVRCKGRVSIRVGPRRAIATPEEERRLTEKGRAKDLPFDLRLITAATLADLDLDLFQRTYLPASVSPEVLEENERTREQQLASLRLVRMESGQAVPTVLGVLVTGRDPLGFIGGAYIQFLRLDGDSLTDPIRDSAAISGPLPDMLRMAEEKLEAHLQTARDFTSGPVEIIRPDYPMVAIQQLVRNAVLHRTYEGTNSPVRIQWFSDRIEILSPGGPYGLVNRLNFGVPGVTDYRNLHLAEAMRNLGYVQKFGMGIALARKKLEENGNPPLQFQVGDTHVLAILRKHP
jgi:ATP-dependent DNA helicase RecG